MNQNMKKIVLVVMGLIPLCLHAYDFNPTKKTVHGNEFGMGETYGQYPRILFGQEAGQKRLLAERLYKQAKTLEAAGGFESNIYQAVQLWEEAAGYGDVPSMYEIGFSYYVGRGVDVDVKKANYYLEFASKREYPDALGLYLVSQMYDAKYRNMSSMELARQADFSSNRDANVYGMLAYLKMYQDGIIKSKDPNRIQHIKNVIKQRLASPNADYVEKNHIPQVISVLKINL